MANTDYEIPENSGQLRPYVHQVLLYLHTKNKWIVQRSVLNCNKVMCWKLLTEKPLNKIHALRILDKINGKTLVILSWDSSANQWVEREDINL
jgi:hypothetical protein